MNRANLYIGTSGYSYAHWRGVFYPEGLKQNRWLEYYAGFFNNVELNVTFYRLPQANAFLSWYKKTPEYFRFSVKGSRFITHIKKLKDCAEPLKLFFSRVNLLKKKLGHVLWQLPASFKVDFRRLRDFIKYLQKYGDAKHVFEFRNETWYRKDVFDLLREKNIALCSADWPEFSKDIKITADFIYLRRHGASAKLYGGCYTNRQLKEDARIIKKCLKEKKDAYIYFNNDAHGYAVKNALELKKLLN